MLLLERKKADYSILVKLFDRGLMGEANNIDKSQYMALLG